jgi:hypothetical protein
MPRKQLEVPPAAARAFVKDRLAFHSEPNTIKRGEIASRQLQVLRGYQGPREKKLRAKEMFEQMKDHA